MGMGSREGCSRAENTEKHIEEEEKLQKLREILQLEKKTKLTKESINPTREMRVERILKVKRTRGAKRTADVIAIVKVAIPETDSEPYTEGSAKVQFRVRNAKYWVNDRAFDVVEAKIVKWIEITPTIMGWYLEA